MAEVRGSSPLPPTRLDKIENFQLEIQTGAVGGGDVKSNDAELASQGRRLAGAVLDGFLFVLTLGIGWVIWYLIRGARRTEPSEATPAYARYPWRWSIGRLGLDADQGLGCACHRFRCSQWGIGGCAGRASGRCHFRAYLRRCSVVVRMGQRPASAYGTRSCAREL